MGLHIAVWLLSASLVSSSCGQTVLLRGCVDVCCILKNECIRTRGCGRQHGQHAPALCLDNYDLCGAACEEAFGTGYV
ncbi:hypothetical protein NP493_234g02050 [Ridgeia piscesae]|uniref:Uncharacterized protein n=1 Tax=Ridgeia piscesae TaxID=27915 RepID=A0AAD9UDM3_RIDPI|nr:hypothetical protein NP493_234g02050 [Ridgeia piscesae]